MLKRHAAFFSLLHSIADIVIIAVAWLGVYYVRFYLGFFSSPKGMPGFENHLLLTIPVVCICYLGCLWTGLYKPKRVQTMFVRLLDVLKAGILGGLMVLAFFYYLQNPPYSRKLLILFAITLFCGLVLSHLFTTAVIRHFRKKGYNLRYYAVIGAGKNGQQLVNDIEQMGWLGLKCSCFVDNNPDYIGRTLVGIPVYGPIDRLTELIKTKGIDEVYLALSGNEAHKAYPFLETLQYAGVTIRIIPDWGHLVATSDATVVTIGSQVLFSASDSPLDGGNIVAKEAFDRMVSLILLIMLAVPMFIIAVLIKLTSKGPVFYKQTRVGMDQKEFEIMKFRTMTIEADKENQSQWTRPGDPRRTRIGAWLRKTSLDEIPQLINVTKGQMSLVGPRPEQPEFVKQFSEEYKKYMLRHKIKAGMTGWAQIHGFRGDTSLKKRLQYDLYYIRNWSFWMDLWILLRTPWEIIKGKNAY
ncbi:MAG: undecaprenyl-phosphate glucose phosphotransferase [Planctomycetota bacterium]|nr:undecaprenyl-phosphate glucose phosphotransferase [Planctomycetota bacterium]